jgi:predicted RNA-binding Zn ribbon-like protein
MPFASLRAGLCLDYANTLSWRGSAAPAEALKEFADLVDWLRRRGAIDVGTAANATRWARQSSAEAARCFSQSLALREAIYGAFRAIATGRPVGNRDFSALKTALGEAPVRHELVRINRGFAWQVAAFEPTAPYLIAPVLWSAADLLLAEDPPRVRRCANDACLWLFIDASKNGTRRWCDMASCGNRAKARRHYLRHKPD